MCKQHSSIVPCEAAQGKEVGSGKATLDPCQLGRSLHRPPSSLTPQR